MADQLSVFGHTVGVSLGAWWYVPSRRMMVTSRIDGVQIHELQDERGAILHVLGNDEPDFVRFGESCCSEGSPGAIKGWKRHWTQTQNLAVPVGRKRLVIFD